TWETLTIIGPVAVALTFVGLLESLLTATIVDRMTGTASDKNREARGQGIANIVAGLFGGMAGCAMIGQSVINVGAGGRGRLSAFVAGSVLLVLVVALQDWVVRIPMAALVAVMIMVSVGTFDWSSLRRIRTIPATSTLVMAATTATVVYTHDLSKGVLVGVLMSAVFFVRKVARLVRVEAEDAPDGTKRRYIVTGQVFFASADRFAGGFDRAATPAAVEIDLAGAHFWDVTAVAALDRVVQRLRAEGATVSLVGLNAASATLIEAQRAPQSAAVH
ncbi:MAG TPA: SulP family inorganic anion transporter, partial [Alphaproteobacteria bacterium]|nr:SulP family inorganic anion transporter [Alphaproteobacteria bacterium]